jgi:putative aldouronate transport system permease protein
MRKHTISSRIFDFVIIIFITLYAAVCILPFIHIVAGSFTTSAELLRKGFVLIPTEYSLESYRYIFSTSTLIRSMGVTIYVTVIGTILNVIFTALLAYPLARKDVAGRSFVLKMVVFTMLFSGGMIPSFLLVKQLGMLNTLWSLMLPGLIGAFILIILKSFFQNMPDSIEESAKIDGANDLQILYKIVLPLSMPAIATISLFYAVGHWNTFMTAVLYLNNSELWPIQVLLRQIILMSSGNFGDSSVMDEGTMPPAQTVKMAVIVVATVPILLVYPFLQKHFTKGAMLGSVKG